MAMQAITFHRSKHVILQDLNVFNSQQMHVAFTSCSHVRVSRLKVIAPDESPNTDGIHISESHSIVVENNSISTGVCRQNFCAISHHYFTSRCLFSFNILAFVIDSQRLEFLNFKIVYHE